jgi:hypothetical protein
VSIRNVTDGVAPLAIDLADHPQQVTFTLNRQVSRQAMLANVSIVDDCGAWTTFVGSGS